jgi:arylsulfatase A-like enzyme
MKGNPFGLLRNLFAIALVLGLAGGLVEGVVHMVLQRFVLENVWYQIVWIAALFNAAVLAISALALSPLVGWLPRPSGVRTTVFLLTVVALVPVLALTLKQWVHPVAILILVLGVGTAFTRWVMTDETRRLELFGRSLPWVAVLSGLTLVSIQGGLWWTERSGTNRLQPLDAKVPDVLVIIIDALRADHLSSYGYDRPTSPSLDRFAAEGALFEQAYSTSSYTLPSHVSILTGLSPHEHGAEWLTSKVHGTAAYPTLAETLQAKGYRTGAFSGNTYWFSREHGFGRGFLHFEDFFGSLTDMAARTAYGQIAVRVLRRFGYEDIPARKRAPDTNAAVLRWIDRDLSHPLFVTINYMDVHDPYMPLPPYRTKFSKQAQPGGRLNWQLRVPPSLRPEQLQGEIDAYDGAIAYVDEQIDALVQALRQRRSDRDLLLIVTSDHGEEFYEHGSFLHGNHVYREVIHVPLIVAMPGRIPAGLRVSQPVSNASIPATIMSLIASQTAPFPGPSLQELLTTPGPVTSWPAPLVELGQKPWVPAPRPVRFGSMRSLIDSRWQYVEHETLGAELYDWVADPREQRNVVNEPDSKAAAERLRDKLAGRIAEHRTLNSTK